MTTPPDQTVAAAADAIPYKDLPDGHLFRLLEKASEDDYFDDSPPVDWHAVLQRLETNQEEVRQWVQLRGGQRRLFLHQILDCDYGQHVESRGEAGGSNEELGGEQRETAAESNFVEDLKQKPIELQVMFITIGLYREALSIPDSRGYYPVHLVCRCGHSMDIMSPLIPFGWRRISYAVLEMVAGLYPRAAAIQADEEGKTALNHLCSVSYRDEEPVDAFRFLLSLCPDAISIPDKYGSYPPFFKVECN